MENKPLDIAKNLDKLSTLKQVGGIELYTIENGPGRSLRVAHFNTGSGLNFKVVLDRGMDITEAFFNHYGLAWL